MMALKFSSTHKQEKSFFHQLAGYTVSSTVVSDTPHQQIEEKLDAIQEENRIVIALLKSFGDAVEVSSKAIAAKTEQKLKRIKERVVEASPKTKLKDERDHPLKITLLQEKIESYSD